MTAEWRRKPFCPDARQGVWYAYREPSEGGPGEVLIVYLVGRATGYQSNDFEVAERRPS